MWAVLDPGGVWGNGSGQSRRHLHPSHRTIEEKLFRLVLGGWVKGRSHPKSLELCI